MNQSVEFHDSKLATISFADGRATIVFSHAYIHRSPGKPGRDSGTVWSQSAELFIEGSAEIDSPGSWPCTISEGRLELNEIVRDNEIPIPSHHEGKVKLKLGLIEFNGTFRALEIAGTSARLRLLGEAQYVEEFCGRS